MPLRCYTTVSDLAICQRCPTLFAYRVHEKKTVWYIGINGGGEAYGSIFHKEISEKFFRTASDPRDPLHEEISRAVVGGADALEECIRKNFFVPLIDRKADSLTSGQILNMAQAVRVWVRRMAEFFGSSMPVFIKPEMKMTGCYSSKEHDADLIIKGRYDAMIFNTNRREIRLFEFKAFRKSDVTVPLSQSLMYSWLLQKSSGIIPSIEIIYLDDEESEIFSPKVVREMIIEGLPGLFNKALDIILLRRIPKMFYDDNLCPVCKFKRRCKFDMKRIFSRPRRGASLLSVMVFMFAATMITAQVFFFSNLSADSVKDEREITSARLQLASIVENVKNNLTTNSGRSANWLTFQDLAKEPTSHDNTTHSKYYDLDYTYNELNFDETKWNKIDATNKLFPPMTNYYLIRAYKELPRGKNLMLQVLVDNSGEIKTYEEIWY
ncbi:MAG: PD-(D/E)XK nuclease family protein [Synergistaceae bacterium]|nr:PD-(D/E)XK nuclease family protein [Synergistaceae bacterium]